MEKKEFFNKLADLLEESNAYIAGNANFDYSFLVIENDIFNFVTEDEEWLNADSCRRIAEAE